MNRPLAHAAALALIGLAAAASAAAAQETTPAPPPPPAAGPPAPAATDARKQARPERPPRVRRDRHLITREEFQNRVFSNAYDLVQSLRPAWLSTMRGSGTISRPVLATLVYVDGVRMGDVGALRSVNPIYVVSLQYLDAPTATQRFGGDSLGPAIVVTTR